MVERNVSAATSLSDHRPSAAPETRGRLLSLPWCQCASVHRTHCAHGPHGPAHRVEAVTRLG